jgi:membrane fusion protein (multidrug efflux system)
MTKNTRNTLCIALLAALALAGGWARLNHRESSDSVQITDDAYVRADMTVIVPEISGRITAVAVEDNQQVATGDPLVHIDDQHFRIALAAADAQVAAAQATAVGLRAQLARHSESIAQARATLRAAEAALTLATANRDRFDNLARDGSGTVQARQQAQTQWETQHAARDRDLAALHAAEKQTAVLKAELAHADAAVLSAQAARDEATLQLSHAAVHAPSAGVVAQRQARVGGYARVGVPLLTLVPLDAIYVEANFRETQLARVQVGQPVAISVDALPDITFAGHVDTLGPASGASFSTVPPHNATGNFTKITQRLPVRIRLDAGQPAVQRLRVGMSVHTRIDTDAPAAH